MVDSLIHPMVQGKNSQDTYNFKPHLYLRGFNFTSPKTAFLVEGDRDYSGVRDRYSFFS